MPPCNLQLVGPVSQHAYKALRASMANTNSNLQEAGEPDAILQYAGHRAGEASMPTKHWMPSWHQQVAGSW